MPLLQKNIAKYLLRGRPIIKDTDKDIMECMVLVMVLTYVIGLQTNMLKLRHDKGVIYICH